MRLFIANSKRLPLLPHAWWHFAELWVRPIGNIILKAVRLCVNRCIVPLFAVNNSLIWLNRLGIPLLCRLLGILFVIIFNNFLLVPVLYQMILLIFYRIFHNWLASNRRFLHNLLRLLKFVMHSGIWIIGPLWGCMGLMLGHFLEWWHVLHLQFVLGMHCNRFLLHNLPLHSFSPSLLLFPNLVVILQLLVIYGQFVLVVCIIDYWWKFLFPASRLSSPPFFHRISMGFARVVIAWRLWLQYFRWWNRHGSWRLQRTSCSLTSTRRMTVSIVVGSIRYCNTLGWLIILFSMYFGRLWLMGKLLLWWLLDCYHHLKHSAVSNKGVPLRLFSLHCYWPGYNTNYNGYNFRGWLLLGRILPLSPLMLMILNCFLPHHWVCTNLFRLYNHTWRGWVYILLWTRLMF